MYWESFCADGRADYFGYAGEAIFNGTGFAEGDQVSAVDYAAAEGWDSGEIARGLKERFEDENVEAFDAG